MSLFPLIVIGALWAGLSGAHGQGEATDFNSAYRLYQQSIENGDTESALLHIETAFPLGLEVFGEENPTSAVLAANYSQILRIEKKRKRAAKISTIARELAERAHGESSPELLKYLSAEASAHIDIYEHDHAVEITNRGLKLAEDIHGSSSIEYADALVLSANADTRKGWQIQSRKKLERALETYINEVGLNDPKTARANFDIGKYQMAWGRHKTAIKHLSDAIDAWSTNKPKYLSLIGSARAFLVESYSEEGLTEKATEQTRLLALEMVGRQGGNADANPLFRKRPSYPPEAAKRRSTGWVHLSFTIDPNGFVKDIEIVNREGHRSLERSATRALAEWRYAPAVVDGKFVPRHNNKVVITFELDK